MTRISRLAASVLAIAMAMAMTGGCASTGGLAPRNEIGRAGDLQAGQTFAGAGADDAAWPAVDWWRRFGDPQLDGLVAEALAGSPTLQAAQARLDRARAAAGTAQAALLPQVELGAESTRGRYSEHDVVPPPVAGSWQTASRAVLDFGYEFDLRGANGAALAAAGSNVEAARIDAFAARMLLSVAVAREYVQLQRLCDQLDVAHAELGQRQQIYDLTGRLVEAGIENRVALKQAQVAVPIARETIVILEEAAAVTRHQIAALLGQGPDRGLDIRRPALRPNRLAAPLPSRLPADLLGRRPDVAASRWRVEAAGHGIDFARAQFYPNVDLRAYAGFQSIGLSDFLVAGSGIAGIGPALRLPIFEGGRLKSELAGADAAYDAAVARYNAALVDALRDLGDRLAAIRSVAAQGEQQRIALGAAREAYQLALLRYRGGIGSYLDVLSARGQVLSQERLAADLHAREFANRIELVRALGGGFDGAAAASPAS